MLPFTLQQLRILKAVATEKNFTKAAQVLHRKLILNTPAVIVITLNGMGVTPAVNTISQFHSSYIPWTFSKTLGVNPGT